MARIRKFCAYRRLERPYTRKSKYRSKSFVRATPNSKIVKFDMGNLSRDFKFSCTLHTKVDLNIRHNALEAARQTSNRVLEKKLGRPNYRLKILVFPHHILRENPLASGAGADRMSTGMKMSFGKPISSAARVKEGQAIVKIFFAEKENLKTARLALTRASHKIPCGCFIEEQSF